MRNRLLTAILPLLLFAVPVLAEEEFYCEVMSVEGTATLSNATTSGRALSEGDLLSVDDVVTVGASSYVDVAYDRDWNNITRVEENSSIRIRSLYPTELELQEGGVFAKLKSLPKDSSFDVQTPTAIASVRGTEYRTTYTGGETQIYNVSDSDVYVFGIDTSGQTQAEPVIIKNSEKTFIQKRGEAPVAPRPMEARDISHAAGFQRGIEQRVMQNIDRGRTGKLPDVGAIERRLGERRGQGGPGGMSPHMDREMKRMEVRGGQQPGQPKSMGGDQQRRQAGEKTGQGSAPNGGQEQQGGGLVSGQGMQGRRPQEARQENPFEGRGIAEPFFPGDESHRSGGPEPAGMPDQRWKSADEKNGPGNQPGPGQPGMDKRQEGPNGMQQGPGPGQPQQGQPQGKQQPQNRPAGGAKPAPRRQ